MHVMPVHPTRAVIFEDVCYYFWIIPIGPICTVLQFWIFKFILPCGNAWPEAKEYSSCFLFSKWRTWQRTHISVSFLHFNNIDSLVILLIYLSHNSFLLPFLKGWKVLGIFWIKILTSRFCGYFGDMCRSSHICKLLFLWVLRFDFMLHHSVISKSPLKYLLIVMYGAIFSGHFPGFFKVHFIQLPF